MNISIALCTFNGAHFLGDQLESLAAQTRLPDELVVCDDCSSDDTLQILRDFGARAPFEVRLFENQVNLGSTKNFERALEFCRGDSIALCDQDDVWRDDKLTQLQSALEANQGAGLAFSDAQIMDEKGDLMEQRLWPLFNFYPQKCAPTFETLLHRNVVTGATLLMRAEYKPLLLPIPTGPLIHDAWFAALIAAVADVVAVNEPLLYYRRHAGQQVGFQSAPAEAGTTTHYDNQFAQLRAMRARLENCRTNFGDERLASHLSMLEARISHLQTRLALPQAKLARLPRITGELLNGGYARYSNGWRSAAKDALR